MIRSAPAAGLDPDAVDPGALVRLVASWLQALREGFTEDPIRGRTLLAWLAPSS